VRVLVLALAAVGCKINFDQVTSGDGGTSADAADGSVGSIKVVQEVQATSIADASSIQVALPAPPTLGNTIVAYLWTWTNGSTVLDAGSASDSFGNGFALAGARFTATGGCAAGMGGGGIFVAPVANAFAAPYAVTVAPGGDTMQQLALAVVEYEGLSANPVQDSASMETVGDTPLTFGTGTVVAEADSLLVAVATECGGFPNPITWTSTFNVRGIESKTQSVPPGIAGDRIVSTAGATQESWTVDYTGSGPREAVGVIAALR
jgi:hypothetical protein